MLQKIKNKLYQWLSNNLAFLISAGAFMLLLYSLGQVFHDAIAFWIALIGAYYIYCGYLYDRNGLHNHNKVLLGLESHFRLLKKIDKLKDKIDDVSFDDEIEELDDIECAIKRSLLYYAKMPEKKYFNIEDSKLKTRAEALVKGYTKRA